MSVFVIFRLFCFMLWCWEMWLVGGVKRDAVVSECAYLCHGRKGIRW